MIEIEKKSQIQKKSDILVMHPAPAEPCFFLTKRGFTNASLGNIATTVPWRSGLGCRIERGKRCTSFGFDSCRRFACDMFTTIGFVKIIEKIRMLVLLVLGTLLKYATGTQIKLIHYLLV